MGWEAYLRKKKKAGQTPLSKEKWLQLDKARKKRNLKWEAYLRKKKKAGQTPVSKERWLQLEKARFMKEQRQAINGIEDEYIKRKYIQYVDNKFKEGSNKPWTYDRFKHNLVNRQIILPYMRG